MILKMAEEGNAGMTFLLARMYDNGQGVEQSDTKAATWYRKAAQGGNAKAQFLLGSMCEKGKGVPIDHREAAEWYWKAAEQGHEAARARYVAMLATGRLAYMCMNAFIKRSSQ